MFRVVWIFLFLGWGMYSWAQELKEGYYPDGKIRYRGYFVQGQPQGQLTRYYPDGKVKAVLDHQGNEVTAVLYSQDGLYTTEGVYINRKKEGMWKYQKEKKLLMTEEYRNNQLEGTVTRYYPSGQVAEIRQWKEGVPSGRWRLYYDNGKPRMEAVFVAGKLDGKMTSYEYDGTLAAEGMYRKDLKEGEWKYYDPQKKMEYSRIYHAGVPENAEELENAESRRLDTLLNAAKKIPDPALFTDDPEAYIKLTE